jgi:hypothetical protein
MTSNVRILRAELCYCFLTSAPKATLPFLQPVVQRGIAVRWGETVTRPARDVAMIGPEANKGQNGRTVCRTGLHIQECTKGSRSKCLQRGTWQWEVLGSKCLKKARDRTVQLSVGQRGMAYPMVSYSNITYGGMKTEEICIHYYVIGTE